MTGTPQVNVPRESETSRRPDLMKESASLRRVPGRTHSGFSAYSRSSGSWKEERRKNQFSSCSRVSGILWIGQVLPSAISFSLLKSAQRGQYQPS